mmetsp:Transcript_3016/g.9991  ORF Transcript_3016/g.9991 Transcript_3016/m.9991 type:complete len:215 (-) Transcript_3016:968-1612(-)
MSYDFVRFASLIELVASSSTHSSARLTAARHIAILCCSSRVNRSFQAANVSRRSRYFAKPSSTRMTLTSSRDSRPMSNDGVGYVHASSNVPPCGMYGFFDNTHTDARSTIRVVPCPQDHKPMKDFTSAVFPHPASPTMASESPRRISNSSARTSSRPFCGRHTLKSETCTSTPFVEDLSSPSALVGASTAKMLSVRIPARLSYIARLETVSSSS